MFSKSKKFVIVLLSILGVLILVLGVWGIYYTWNESTNAKLEIAELLGISNVDSNTIEEDMRCSWKNDIITVKYRGEIVYFADMVYDNKLRVCDLNNIEYGDYGIAYHTKETTLTDYAILKCIDHVDSGQLREISVVGIVFGIVFGITLIVCVALLIFEKKNVEAKASTST